MKRKSKAGWLFPVVLWAAAAWAQSPVALETQARLSVARAKELAGQMEELDRDIERRVDRVIELIKPVTDSTESKTRVANLKEDLMRGLGKSIEFYRQQRAKRQAELQRPLSATPRESLAKDIDYLDDRIEKRVEQIVDLAGTLARHDNFEKYEYHYRPGGRNDNRGVSQRVSDEYRHSRRQGSKSTAVKEEVVEGLSKDLDRRKQEAAEIKQALSRPQPEEREDALREQLEEREEKIAVREEQVGQVLTAEPGPSKEVGKTEAHALEQRVRAEVEGIRKDFQELVRLKSEFDLELGRAKSFRTRSSYVD